MLYILRVQIVDILLLLLLFSACDVQRVVTLDDRIAWAHYEFTDELLNGNTVEEWISLSGKQGDDKEGVINVILSFSVS